MTPRRDWLADDWLGWCRSRRGKELTKGVPQDHSQFGNLLSLLAELQEGGFARGVVEEVGDESHGATVVLGQSLDACLLEMPAHGCAHVGAALDAAVVLLLGGIDGRLLRLVLLLIVGRVHPRRVGMVVVVLLTVHVGRRSGGRGARNIMCQRGGLGYGSPLRRYSIGQ